MPNFMKILAVGVARLHAVRRTVMKLVGAFRGYAKSAQSDKCLLQRIARQVACLRYGTFHSRPAAFQYGDI